jgi:protein-tyrosine phosphatase
MAEGLLREELKLRNMGSRVGVHSAGTHVTLSGQPADARARRLCAREGIDLAKARTRQVTEGDFKRFSYILAMDRKNLAWLQDRSPNAWHDRISLLGSWSAGETIADIPDPYFGSQSGFEDVLEILHRCVEGFLAEFMQLEDVP